MLGVEVEWNYTLLGSTAFHFRLVFRIVYSVIIPSTILLSLRAFRSFFLLFFFRPIWARALCAPAFSFAHKQCQLLVVVPVSIDPWLHWVFLQTDIIKKRRNRTSAALPHYYCCYTHTTPSPAVSKKNTSTRTKRCECAELVTGQKARRGIFPCVGLSNKWKWKKWRQSLCARGLFGCHSRTRRFAAGAELRVNKQNKLARR